MANYYSTRDLKKAVLRNAGELDDGNSPYDAIATTYLNKFYLGAHAGASVFDIDCGDAWAWAKADNDGILILVPPYKDGFVNVTKGSDIVTFTVPPTESVLNWKFRAENDSAFYNILVSDTPFNEFKIDSPYLGETGQKAFKIIKTDYELIPDGETKIMRLTDGFRVQNYNEVYQYADWNGKITEVSQNNLFENPINNYGYNCRPGQCAEIKYRNGVKTYRFDGVPDQNPIRLNYTYIPIPNDLVDADDNIPNIPREFRDFLEAAASYKLLLDKDDNRADSYAVMAKATLMSLVRASRHEKKMTGSRYGQSSSRPEGTRFPLGFWRGYR